MRARARGRARVETRPRASRLDATDRTDDDAARRRAPPIPRPDRRVESRSAPRLDARARAAARVVGMSRVVARRME
jgi:hypothetical protein